MPVEIRVVPGHQMLVEIRVGMDHQMLVEIRVGMDRLYASRKMSSTIRHLPYKTAKPTMKVVASWEPREW